MGHLHKAGVLSPMRIGDLFGNCGSFGVTTPRTRVSLLLTWWMINPLLRAARAGKGYSATSPPRPTPLSTSLRFVSTERTTLVNSSIRRFPLDSPWLQHPPTNLTLLLKQEHREKLRTATPPLLCPLRRPSPVRASLPAPLSNPRRWRLCPTPPVISPPYPKRGKRRIP
jgi:hypothetical protein